MNSDISLASEEGIERKGKRGRKKLTKLLAVYLAMCIIQVLCWYMTYVYNCITRMIRLKWFSGERANGTVVLPQGRSDAL